MPFSKEIYDRAFEIKRKERAAAESRYEEACSAAESDCPELAEVKARMAENGAAMAIIALNGETERLTTVKKECERLAKRREELRTRYRLGESPDYSCAVCRDTGYSGGQVCECVKRLARNICFAELKTNMPIEESRFDNFDLNYYRGNENDPASPRGIAANTLKYCTRFVSRFPSGENLMLSGAPGLGKTHLSLAVASAIIEKGYSVIYSPAQSIIDALAKERFSYGNSEDTAVTVNGCDLLILDDLGTEINTAVSVSIIYNLLNTRILERKSTIISTNLNASELRQRYETRVLSRIIGNYTKRVLSGDDIRVLKQRGDAANEKNAP